MNLMIMKTYTTIIKNLNNFFTDLIKITIFFLKNRNIKICFFNENRHTFKYLKFYLDRKCKKKKIVLLTFEKINFDNINCYVILIKSNFFKEFFFLINKFKYLYTTTPNLNSSLFKKSIQNKTKYIYIQHSPVSLIKAYHEQAFVEFDAVQTINRFQYNEVLLLNKINKKKIKPFRSTYHFLNKTRKNKDTKIDVLIAPTWKTNFYEIKYHLILTEYFKKNNINYILRPHPMSLVKEEISIKELDENKINYDLNPELKIENYENLISNWSGIFIEFALVNKKMPYHVDTSKKILNNTFVNEYETIEEFARRKITHNFKMDNIDNFNFNKFKISSLFNQSEEVKIINNFHRENFF